MRSSSYTLLESRYLLLTQLVTILLSDGVKSFALVCLRFDVPDSLVHDILYMLDGDQCLCKCTIVNSDGEVIAQGHAHEEKGSSNINKTSYVENCETSAVGRALALLGIGIDTSIASANEVKDAIAKQEASPSAPTENIMDKAVTYIKSQTNKQKAFDSIVTKYGDQLSDKQKAGLKKFVR